MSRMVTLEKLSLGYLVTVHKMNGNERMAVPTIEDAFREVLFALEGRSPNLGGTLYGTVAVSFNKENGQ